ncbi:hypothetical protein [Kitasatospora sp. CB01950]|uniref:hypothetical protein n=1 Tax=Kitasatospora sp. CB01950 TaxID=1703930 RepID=UPI0013010619|nr:hypothetical protein [Kitasatospora sp. CB01950]
MSPLAINSAGEDDNSDDDSAGSTAELRDLARDVARRDDVPQDLRQRAQALTEK